MYMIQRTNKGKTSSYDIYSKEEAEEKGILARPWREASAGDWAATDDGWVSECLAVRTYINKQGYAMTFRRFPFAKVWATHVTKLNFSDYQPYIIGNKLCPKKGWVEYEAGQSRAKRLVSVYVKQLLSGSVDYQQLGNIYRQDQKIPEATVRVLLRQDRIKQMVKKELELALEKQGITHDKVVELANEAAQIARTGKYQRPQILLDVAKFFKELLDGDLPKGNVRMIEMGVTREITDKMEAAEAEFKVVNDKQPDTGGD
jgi:hypothetical protein